MAETTFFPRLSRASLDGASKAEVWERGEIVVFAHQVGRDVALLFKAPWEPRILFEGQPLKSDKSRHMREVLAWVHGNLPALFRMLGTEKGLRGFLDDDGQVVVTGVVALKEERWLSHAVMVRDFGAEGIRLPAFAVLGRLSSKSEFQQRIQALFAAGALLQVRGEEEDWVVEGALVEIGRDGYREMGKL